MVSYSLFEIPWFMYFIHISCILLPISIDIIVKSLLPFVFYIHVINKNRKWTIFNSSVLKILSMFFFFITFFILLGRRPIGYWSLICRGSVPDRSATSCIKSQWGPHEVDDQSLISRQPFSDQSPTNCETYLRLLCDLCDRYEFWSRRGRRAVAVYVWSKLL